MQQYRLFIGNEWQASASAQWFDSLDPFSGEPWARIPQGNAEDVDRAVKAAEAAMQGPWGQMSATQRGMLLHRLGVGVKGKHHG